MLSDDISIALNNWRINLVGNTIDPTDTLLLTQVSSMDETVSNTAGTGVWDTMSRDGQYLWESDRDWGANSGQITNTMQKIRQMTVQVATPASQFYQNLDLRDAIIYALNWMNMNSYNSTITTEYNNWWDWEIGTPQALNDVLSLAMDFIPSELLFAGLAAINHFVPDPTVRRASGVSETGANLLDKCFVVALAGVIGNVEDRITLGMQEAGPVYDYVTQGDGYYLDGSFIQHTNIAYTGGYGEVLLSRTRDIFQLFSSTTYLNLLQNIGQIYIFILQTYMPTLYADVDFDMTRGRGISRQGNPAHSVARTLLYDILIISRNNNDADYQQDCAIFIKSAISMDKYYSNYYSGLSINQTQQLRRVIKDDAVPVVADARDQNVSMGSMCQMFHQKGHYACGLSLFSNLISAFEYGNEENKLGWYTGTGMLYLYNSDNVQYDNDYWPTVNMLRLPGTTTDSQVGTLVDWQLYPNSLPQCWSGGVSNGTVGAAGLSYSMKGVTGSSLTAVKSWFMLDDQVIALAAGIGSTDSAAVESIIENRKLQSDGSNTLLVNGTEIALGETQQIDNVQWTHLSDDVNQAPIGYVLLQPTALQVEKVARSGSWQNLNVDGSTEVLTNIFATLSIPHGQQPQAAQYAYVLLPGAVISPFLAEVNSRT